MAATDQQDFNPEHISLYREARNLIFDYTTHNGAYQRDLIDKLSKTDEVYVLFPLKTIVYALLKLNPPSNLLFGIKPPFVYEKIHPFLRYFGGKDAYNQLNNLSLGNFDFFSQEEKEDTESFNKLPEPEKDKKLNSEVSKKEKKDRPDFFGEVNYPVKTYTKTKKEQEIKTFKIPNLSIKKIQIPSFLKNIGVWMLIQAGNLINRHPKISVPISVGTIVGLFEYATTGNPALAWLTAILSTTGVGVASQYLSAPREQYTSDEENQEGVNGDYGYTNLNLPNMGNFNRLGNLYRNKGRRALQGARAAGSGARAAAGLARAAIPLFANPVTWAVIGIILFIILFFFLIFNKNASFFNPLEEQITTTPPTSGTQLKISKTAPPAVPNGSPIPYEITITYTGTGTADITVTDKVPENTDFVAGSAIVNPDSSGVLTWNLSKIQPNQPQKLTFTVTPNKEDIYVQNNNYSAKITGTTGSVTPPEGSTPGEPPNNDTCGGTYSLNNPIGNFGDPGCTFTEDKLFELLNRLDPLNAKYWFDQVIRCESGYNPNAFLAASTSGLGAYGLYQMNPQGQGAGQYDAGNVEWQLQTSNAVTYNNNLTKPWTYWACAIDRW